MRNYTLHEYFAYTRLEKSACNVLVALCISGFLLPLTFPFLIKKSGKPDFTEVQHFASLTPAPKSAGVEYTANFTRNAKPSATPAELFTFDPNTASKEEFVRLGLSPRTAQTILNYRAKGGKFFKKEDFERIYGLRSEDFARLASWINIEAPEPRWNNASKTTENLYGTASSEPRREHAFKNFSSVEKTAVTIDINQATAEEWQQLKGIGPGYSKRIVNYREKLGGFSSVEMVSETYGLPDSTFEAIRPYLLASPVFRKININTATLEELKNHPLLSNFQATVLLNYRLQHGHFSDMASLKKIGAAFKESDWERLEAYISFD